MFEVENLRIPKPFDTWCPLKGHIYLKNPAALSCRFVKVCMTFYWTAGVEEFIHKNISSTIYNHLEFKGGANPKLRTVFTF